MSIKHTSAVGLLLLGLLLAPLAIAGPDTADTENSDVSDENSVQNAEETQFEKDVKVAGKAVAKAVVETADVVSDTTKKFFNALYRKAQAAQPGPDDYQKSCLVLDDEITMLLPLTYRYVPGFYDDPKNAFAIWSGTLGLLTLTSKEFYDVPLWYGYLGFSGYKRYAEEERIFKTNLRIEALRRVKARKRCFESF